MPQHIICSECGHKLYNGLEVKQPVEIILQYNGKCPKCDKSLEYDLNKIQLTALEETRETAPRFRRRIVR